MYQDPMKRKAMPVRPPRATVTPPITQQAPPMAAPKPPPTTGIGRTVSPGDRGGFEGTGTYNPPVRIGGGKSVNMPTTPGMTPQLPGIVQQQNPNGARDMAQQMLNSGGTYKPTATPMGGRAEAIRQQQQDAIRQREIARLNQIMGRG